MYRLKFVFLFLTISLVIVACGSDSPQNADDGAAATIDAQNTRIAELSGENSENAAVQPAESNQPSTAAVNPEPTSTSLPTATPEPATGLVWQREDFTRVLPVPEIGIAVAYIDESQEIQAISLEAGDILWSIQSKGLFLGADKDLVYTLPFEQRVDAFDVNTGELRWFSTLPDPLEPFSQQFGFSQVRSNQNFVLIPIRHFSFNGLVAVSKSDGQVYALEGKDAEVEGEIIIVENGRGYLEPQTPIWDIGDREFLPRCGGIIFNNIDYDTGLVQALDLNTGDEIWQAQLPGNVRYAYCPEHATDESYPQQVFLLTTQWPVSRFVSVERLTGEIQYVNEGVTYSYNEALQQLDEGGNIVFGGAVKGLNIYSQLEFGITTARDTLENTVIWESPNYSLFSIIGEYENTILGVQSVGFPGRQILLGIDALSGELKWTFRPEDEDQILFDVKLVDDVVISLFFDIYFIDIQTGDLLFSAPGIFRLEEFGDRQIIDWGGGKIAVYRLP